MTSVGFTKRKQHVQNIITVLEVRDDSWLRPSWPALKSISHSKQTLQALHIKLMHGSVLYKTQSTG